MGYEAHSVGIGLSLFITAVVANYKEFKELKEKAKEKAEKLMREVRKRI